MSLYYHLKFASYYCSFHHLVYYYSSLLKSWGYLSTDRHCEDSGKGIAKGEDKFLPFSTHSIYYMYKYFSGSQTFWNWPPFEISVVYIIGKPSTDMLAKYCCTLWNIAYTLLQKLVHQMITVPHAFSINVWHFSKIIATRRCWELNVLTWQKNHQDHLMPGVI